MLKPLTRSCAVAIMAGVFLNAATGAPLVRSDEPRARPAAATTSLMSPPIVNWAAPQFFNAPHGAFSSDGSFGKPLTKQSGSAQTLATFIPIAPCRLVDTRGYGVPGPVYYGFSERDSVGTTGHNPLDTTPRPFNGQQANGSVPPGSLSNASLGEYRIYKAPGHCGIPPGSSRVTAVSIAVTTLPTANSGDVEVTATGQALGHSVLMVIQAQLWNSAATETALDASGNFTVQVRSPSASTPISADMAIDVNGYYVVMAAANTSDYFSIIGNYNLDGGLFNVTQTGAGNTLGAAISAVAPGAEVHLGEKANAVDVVLGGIRVRQSGGSPSSSAAYIFSTSGRRCGDLPGGGSNALAKLDNTQVTFTGADLSGLMLFAQPRNTAPAVNVVYTSCSGGAADGWYLSTSGAFAGTEQYNVLIITP